MKKVLIKIIKIINIGEYMSHIRKIKFKLLLSGVILIFIASINMIYEEETNYALYINDRFIAYFNGKSEAKKEYMDALNYLSQEYGKIGTIKGRMKFKKVKDKNINLSKAYEVRENIFKSLEGAVSAKKLTIGTKEIGYVSSDKEKNHVLEVLSDIYINDIRVDRHKIQSIDISGKINLKDMTVDISQIESAETLAKKIYLGDKNSSEPSVIVNLVVRDSFIEEISPSTSIISSKELYWGQNREVKGKNGKKEVLKTCVYENGKIVSEKKVSEKVIVQAQDNIIYSGTKDPITNGIAFLDYPSRGGITSSFGARWGKTHHGIDIAGNMGDPIRAAFDGKVVYTGYNDVYGNMIVVDHGKGVKTVYGHCSRLLVKVAQEVKKGDIIGKIGSTGRSTGPHLHFELRVNDQAINPVKYLVDN